MSEIAYKDHITFLKELASRATQKEEDVRIKDMVTGEVRGTDKGNPEKDTPEPRKAIRTFGTGATRDTDAGKHDYEGYLSPLVIERFGEYMTKHRVQANGAVRDSDNWQKGIPKKEYLKSLFRHFMVLWKEHRAGDDGEREVMEEALCGIFFNVQGYLYELLRLPSFKVLRGSLGSEGTRPVTDEVPF